MAGYEETWEAFLDTHDGFTRGDRARIDQHLSVDATIWDSREHADIAVRRYPPTVTFVDGGALTWRVRNTSVRRRIKRRRLLAHNHQDLLAD